MDRALAYRTASGLLGRHRPLVAAVALGVAVRVLYALSTRHLPLAGDEFEYDLEGRLFAAGHLFSTTTPYGNLHPSAWKAPLYPAWVGAWYSLVGAHPFVVRLAQVPFGVGTICLSWRLADRLAGRRAANLVAFGVALYPMAFQYEELLYSESIATPLTIGFLLLVLTGRPTTRRAALGGLVLGVGLLDRPSAEFLLLAALVFWSRQLGWRRGLGRTAVAAVVAAAVVAPWTVRNLVTLHGFVPISLQDSALYGTFNPQAASDPTYPYLWRAVPPNYHDVFYRAHPLSEVELRSELQHRAIRYIKAHPLSVPAAFFWNGIYRTWDLRSHGMSLFEVPFEGRSHAVSELAIWSYDVLLPLALLGLYRLRRRRGLVAAMIAMALGASVVYTADGGTRYRAPLEPMVAIFAAVGLAGATATGSDRDRAVEARIAASG